MNTPATSTMTAIPARFRPAYDAVAGLARRPRYLGAAIFGSVASGTATGDSDLDVLVMTDAPNDCPNMHTLAGVNHPVIGGVKLDITFHSLDQLRERMGRMTARGDVRPWLAGALVVFDRTGDLAALVAECGAVRPRPATDTDRRDMQYDAYFGDRKIRLALAADPATALFSMHTHLRGLLWGHYILNQQWRVSDKRLLADLAAWDAPLAALVRRFVAVADVGEKFALWTAILDHVLAPLGGRQPIAENNCPCPACTDDLAALLTPVT